MGFNLIRFLTQPDYRAIKRWKWRQGDSKLLYDFDLSEDAVVIDAGCYMGNYSHALCQRSQPTIFAYEPAPVFCEMARERLASFPKVQVECAGLSDFDGETTLFYNDAGSSTQRQSAGDQVKVRILNISEVVKTIDRPIDLLKLNIEGDEYPVLQKLIDDGLMSSVHHLLVQFHRLDKTSQGRYDAIAASLARTHDLAWQYPFVWERWDLKTA